MTIINQLNLKQIFSIAQYQQLKTEVILPSIKAKRSQWVLSRALCLYELVDLRNVPKEDRKNALKFYIEKKSPFSLTEYHCEWHQGFAMSWFWNATSTREAVEEQAVDIFETLPETVLREKEQNDGLYIQNTLDDGFDLQYWADGLLISSQWFGQEPNEEQITGFFKGLPRLADFDFSLDSKLTLLTLPLRNTKWVSIGNSKNHFKGMNLEPALVFFVLASSFSYILWQSIATFKAENELQLVETSISSAFETASPIADARDKAIANQHGLRQLHQLLDAPDQLKLMSTFGKVIKDKQGTLKEWRFNINKLEITIESKNNNALDYVKAMQDIPTVSEVTTEPARESNHIKVIIEFSV